MKNPLPSKPAEMYSLHNTSAGRSHTAESPVAFCFRCGNPGGDDWPTVADGTENVHVDCTPPLNAKPVKALFTKHGRKPRKTKDFFAAIDAVQDELANAGVEVDYDSWMAERNQCCEHHEMRLHLAAVIKLVDRTSYSTGPQQQALREAEEFLQCAK